MGTVNTKIMAQHRDLARLAILGLVLMAIGAEPLIPAAVEPKVPNAEGHWSNQALAAQKAAKDADDKVKANAEKVKAVDDAGDAAANAYQQTLPTDKQLKLTQDKLDAATADQARKKAEDDAKKLRATAKQNSVGRQVDSREAEMMKKAEDDSRSAKAKEARKDKVEEAESQADKAAGKTEMAKLEKDTALNSKAKEIGTKKVQHAKTMADFKTELQSQQQKKLNAERAKEDAKKTAEKQEATKAAAKAAEAKRLQAACIKTCPTQCKPAASRLLLGELLELGNGEPTKEPVFKDADSIMRRAHQKVTQLREVEDKYKN